MMFEDRSDAGRRLARALVRYKDARPLVLALPRGGVPVGFEVARVLRAPLEVLVVRKLGAPFEPEVGIGALAEDGTVLVDANAAQLGVDDATLAAIAARERDEAARRVQRFRDGRPLPDLVRRTVILVDDGIATGWTVRAAIRAVRARKPRRLVLAVPVAAAQTAAVLRAAVDEMVCLVTPEELRSIGNWYRDFHQVPDEEVLAFLQRARESAEAETTQGMIPGVTPRDDARRTVRRGS